MSAKEGHFKKSNWQDNCLLIDIYWIQWYTNCTYISAISDLWKYICFKENVLENRSSVVSWNIINHSKINYVFDKESFTTMKDVYVLLDNEYNTDISLSAPEKIGK